MPTYHSFHYGKMNQSFKIENESNESLFEVNLIKFSLLGESNFEIVNNIDKTTTSHKISKVTTVDQGVAGMSMSTASYFKIDKVNCFDLLEEKGYSFKLLLKLDILHPEFALIDKNGYEVAIYKMNVIGPKEEGVGAIGNKQSNTVINTTSNDLESIFLAAFIISTVDFSLYLL